jgi:uncharacterized protein YndB with AHSA1/START domain
MRPGAGCVKGGSVAVDIAAPIGMVFDYVTDPAHFNELMPGVVFFDVDITPAGVGTTYRFPTRVIGIAVRGSGEFTEFQHDRHIHDETSLAMEGSFDWWFEPHGDGVRVATEHQTDRFWNLPVVGPSADSSARAERRTLERLTNTLEAATPRSRGGTS